MVRLRLYREGVVDFWFGLIFDFLVGVFFLYRYGLSGYKKRFGVRELNLNVF